MSFDIISASKNITEKYVRYLKTAFDISDPEYKRLFEKEIKVNGSFSKGPYLDVVDSFENGNSVKELIDNGLLHQDFEFIPDIYSKTLYRHQEKSIRKLNNGKNVIVSTGTGSGKTESFMIPILNFLMIEKSEKGKLAPGVRALLIYPMNALANDQISRLRRYLEKYPYITFGSYTGQTLEKTESALEKYKSLNGGKKPLKNELISREQMKQTPPNILITNYSMLEYLMLRPKDNTLFQGKYADKWKYIVLDEAHTYSGSTGIEVSMLLRRLESFLDKDQLQFILTSATLGNDDANGDVAEFGRRLCGVPFFEEDIIRANRIKLEKEESDLALTNNDYEELNGIVESGYDEFTLYKMIENYTKYPLDNCTDYSEYLYNYLIKDSTFWKVKEYLKNPKTVLDICNFMKWNERDVSNFVNVASKAVKNRKKLFDSRYHLFIRATDGVFVTLGEKKLSLQRLNKTLINNQEYQYFEIVTCSFCHSIYLIGNIEDREKGRYLVQKSNIDTSNIKEAFLLGDKASDDDEDVSLEDEHLSVKNYELCPHCGFIREANLVKKVKCEHNESDYIKLVKVRQSETTGRVTKCISCEGRRSLGVLRHFFSGQEASTSVIGTALFEELPNKESRVIVHDENDGFDDGFGGFESSITETTAKAKQFIAFSDNRQAAAFFATYFYETYEDFLYSKVINDNLKNVSSSGENVDLFVSKMSHDFKENKLSPMNESSPDYTKEAWKAMMREFVENKSLNSLSGLGLMNIDFVDELTFPENKKFKLSSNDVRNICLIFTMWMLSENAIFHGQKFSEADIAFYSNNNIENSYVLSNPKDKYVKPFLPKTDSSSNKRLEFLERVLKSNGLKPSREDCLKLLEAFWNHFFNGKMQLMVDNPLFEGKRFNVAKLKVLKSKSWFRCNKCKRITAYNVGSNCPTFRCDGLLESIDVDSLEKENHYYRMYNDLNVQPLRVVEHTAQLSNEEAYKLQERFKNQEIDVLSCSTTFEMGVDIGDLETVFMRNMPPMPSNYIQRAGRAGRSIKSAALALTFCNKSNHDFSYFSNPVSMINGEIKPPLFKVENEKIGIRHLYSVALSFFWKNNPEYFGKISDFFESDNSDTGYVKFKEYLYDKPDDLKQYLKKVFEGDLLLKYEIETFGWVEWMFDNPKSTYPNLKNVYEQYNEEVSILKREKVRLESEEKNNGAILYRLNTYTKENVISFLSRANILPKYGFPVDTVDLKLSKDRTVNKSLGVELSRDLSMAISEYAPGCEVIAAGNLITSRYVKRMPSKAWKEYDYIKCPNCSFLNIDVHRESTDGISIVQCKQCHTNFETDMVKTFIIPEFGFESDHKISKPSLVKPEKTYRTEASLVNYGSVAKEVDYSFNDNLVHILSVEDGEIAILNSSDFFVCNNCGYALGQNEVKTAFGTKIIKEHKTSYGNKCTNSKLNKYTLGYRFKTDAMILKLGIEMSFNEAYSVLQAIILATCQQLNIDNSEIAGCLALDTVIDGLTYDFILYDTTPGGAGHIKRIINEKTLSCVIKLAYAKANNCRCGGEEKDSSCYNCLRTYQNQHYHDVIKRKYVINKLANFINHN